MILRSKVKITEKYKGRSKFSFWTNINIEDILSVSLKISSPGRSSNGLYATRLNIKNITTKTQFKCSLSEAEKYLIQLKYENIN